MGAQNIINTAIDTGVKRVLALSTDKAVNPINLYGATKLCAEKLFVQGNAYSGVGGTLFSCVRYGNVVGSRGSVIPLFMKQKQTGKITITDDRMTRFWITLEQGVQFVLNSLETMQGGEIFIPKIPSMKLTDLAEAIAPGCQREVIGIRPGEKLHEALISEDESRHTVEKENAFVIQPENPLWTTAHTELSNLQEGFSYTSDKNSHWLTVEELKQMFYSSEECPQPSPSTAENQSATHYSPTAAN
jgi:UDP-N-acetylglucosamine 4,6-dehydratase